jgi:ABC-2 type transport system ATP-binding protein
MESVLSIQGTSKNYGKLQALDNVSFEVPKGSVFGILGPNGSGKTTLLSIILDILSAQTGTFEWFQKISSCESRKRIGSLLETPNFYHYLSAVDNLKITQAISGRGTLADIDSVLEIVNLSQRKNSKFSTYSLGMKQRLAIGGALLGNPEVLVLDEPTNGLDPVGIAEIRNLIKAISKQGKTVIMASHLLDEVEKVCTHVAILKKGSLLTSGAVEEVLVNEDIVELRSSDILALENILENYPNKTNIKKEENSIQLFFPAGSANLEDINKYCFENGITLNLLLSKKKSLETKFLEITGTSNN